MESPISINYLRYSISVILIILHIYHYYSQPFRFSAKEECYSFAPIRCDNLFFGLIIILILLEVLYIAFLSNHLTIFENYPREWWLIIPILSFGIAHIIRINPLRVEEDGTYRARPDSVMARNKRITLMTVTLLLLSLAIIFEIGLSLYNRAESMEDVSKYIFFRDRVDTPFFVFAILRFLAIPILLFYRYVYDNYGACKYGFPMNWN
tara:strand:+ start:528 stop:1151 length:624 start_codon:yes stop_codon:yes gene_type:complete